MHFSLATTLLAVAATAVAQTTHTVLVGDGGQLAFSPSNITAAMGDKVAFEFRAKNHTVTQSTFAAPCVPAGINGSDAVNSGFMAIPTNSTLQPGQFPTWTITVNTTGPLWFHCAQTLNKNHCQAGMVFSINETPEKSFAAYLAAAMASDPSAAASASDPAAVSGSDPTAAAGSSNATLTPGAASGAIGESGSSDPSGTGTGSAEASSQSVGVNGASSLIVSRGAAGLFATLTIGALFI